MTPKIKLKKVWSSKDSIELLSTVCDGVSSFTTKVDVPADHLDELIADLQQFNGDGNDRVFNIELGAFGPFESNGALFARVHTDEKGDLYISTAQESKFRTFSGELVASEAKMYLKTKPDHLSEFIDGLKQLATDLADEIILVCVQ